ncbi:MAG TPA: IclR family transcriptional regulator [Rhizomicrobium sp.]|nr:IclR family transcriptional regulator [Rhizomicrobium sp.]
MATPRNHSVMRAFALLRAFESPLEWVSSSELSRRAKLPVPSGYRLLQTLEAIGAVVRDSRRLYRPGSLMLSFTDQVTMASLLRDVSHPQMTLLARSLGLTIHLGILEYGMVTYLAKVSSPGAFPVHTKVGAQLEPYCSGLGKVLLASLPDREVENFIMDGELIALTPNTIRTGAALRAEIIKVREQGYALDDREHHANMRCLAVPVRDQKGFTVAALSATDDAERMTQERQAEIRTALLEAAASLQQLLYPQSWPVRRRPGRAES